MADQLSNSMSNFSEALNDVINRNIQKMQQRELMKGLIPQQGGQGMGDLISQGFGNQSSVSMGLNAGDLLSQLQPQNAIERSAGRTNIKLPALEQFNQAALAQNEPQFQQPQQQVQPMSELQQADRSWETPAIRGRRELQELKGKTALEKQKIVAQSAKQKQIDKETFPYYKKIKDQHATTSEVDARLDEMQALLDTGKVQGGNFVKGMEALSQIPYVGKLASAVEQAFLTTESQVFKKLSTDFLRDAKPYFGSNLSTREVELFLERVPSLMLSNDGNRAVIRNFRAINDYVKEHDKVLEGIIAENGGERPRHLESKVQARMKNAAENLRKAFRDSVKLIPQKEVKKQQHRTKELIRDVPIAAYKERFLSSNSKPQTKPI